MSDDERKLAEIEARWAAVGPWHMGVWSHGGPGGGVPIDWYVGDANDDAVVHTAECYEKPRGFIGRIVALLTPERCRSQQYDGGDSPTDAECARGQADMQRVACAPQDVAWLIARVKELEWAAECAAVARMDGDA